MPEPQPLYLSRLVVDPGTTAGRRVIADVYHTHQTLARAFDQLGPDDRLLWRWEPGHPMQPALLAQSTIEPHWARIPPEVLNAQPEVKNLSHLPAALTLGRRLAFALTANASRKIDTRTGPDGARRHGRRVPLRRPDDQLRWLHQRAEQHGFALHTNHLGVPDVRVNTPTRLRGRRGQHHITIEATRYEGSLVVTDPDRFIRSIRSGIGPARAFGCGLLTVAPVH